MTKIFLAIGGIAARAALRQLVCLLLLSSAMIVAQPASAQFGDLFRPLRPPGNVPEPEPDEQVPDIPRQGRVLPAPLPPPPGQSLPPPGSVRSEPLPPPPGSTPRPGVANAPAANPSPGLPSGQRQPRRTEGDNNVPPSQATLQPGDEVVTEPPKVKIVNKRAVFSGLDKITGRIINFDAEIGETVQFGALRVKTDACYTRPPTEAANTDAFVEVEEITLQGEVKPIFTGWMFATSPGLHAVEHPIYDVWLTGCKDPENASVAEDAAPKTAPIPQPRRAPQQRSQTNRPPSQNLPPFR